MSPSARPWTLDAWGMAITGLVFVLGAGVAGTLSGGVLTGWGLGAMLIAVLYRAPVPRWWGYLAMAASGKWLSTTEVGWHGTARLVMVVGDVLAIAAAAGLLRRRGGIDFRKNLAIWTLLAVGVVVAAIRCSALAVAAAAAPERHLAVADFLWLTAGGSLVTALTVTPLVLLIGLELPLQRPDADWVRRVPPVFIALIIAMALTYSDLTAGITSAEFLPVPVVVFGLLYLHRLEAAAMLTLTIGWVAFATAHGVGPFVRGPHALASEAQQMLAALAFLLTSALVGWFVLAQRGAAAAAENELRATFDLASTPLEVETFDGRRIRANAATLDFFETTAEELWGYHWTQLSHPDDIAEDAGLLRQLQAGTIDQYRLLKRYVLPNGKLKWGHLTVTRASDSMNGGNFIVTQIIDMTAEQAALERLDFELDHDAVTGLLSRRGIARVLDTELASPQTTGVAVLLVDLTEFVVINTTLGHEAADEAMAMVARAVAAASPAHASIGRFDGFLLLVVVPVSDRRPFAMEDTCTDILQAAAAELTVRGHRIIREARIGASVSTPGTTAAALLREANAALSQGKDVVDLRWSLYDRAGGADETARLAVEHELRVALERDELVVFLQPMVRLSGGAPVGNEALVRWQHPVRGLLAPAEFLPEAERAGLMGAIGQHMLQSVCALLRDRPELQGRVSINVSPLELTSRGWVDRFEQTVRASGVDFARLAIEFTETAAMRLSPDIVAGLRELRDLGVGIHVDDFGTGYSSIALLRELPVTGLKLDRSFVDDLANPDGSAVALATGLAGLAKGLDLETIAEGIETREQAALLRGIGWEVGQGYLFGRPAPVPPVE